MFDEVALQIVRIRHGVTSRAELRARGVTRNDLELMDRSRNWERPTAQTFRRVGSAHSEAQDLAIAVLDSGPDAVLSHVSSARWWGLTGCALRPVHVTRHSSSRRSSTLTVTHRVRALPDEYVTELDGIPIVRPELCALQLFAVCREARAERLTDSLWAMRLLSGPSVARFLARLGRSGRNGTAALRRYLERRGPDYIPPATGLESRVNQILHDAGIPVRRQVDSGSLTAWTGRVDFRHLWLPILIEVQSERYHSALLDQESDRQRIGSLEAAGYQVVEISDTEAWATPWTVVNKVRDAIRRAST